MFPALLKRTTQPIQIEVSIELAVKGFDMEAKPMAAPCDKCKDVDFQDSDEIITCNACGYVIERRLDMGAEYRFFHSDDRGGGDPCRVGAPTDVRFADSSLGTIILGIGKGGHSTARGAMMRIRRFHTWSMFPYKKRSLLHVFEQMTLAASNHGIEIRVIETAKDLYMQLVDHCDKRGLSRASVVASCIYSALKWRAHRESRRMWPICFIYKTPNSRAHSRTFNVCWRWRNRRDSFRRRQSSLLNSAQREHPTILASP